MPSSLIRPSGYSRLLRIIRRELSRGLIQAQKDLEYRKLITYWRTGQHIILHMLKEKMQVGQGTGLYRLLAQDLDLSRYMIGDMVRVYRFYPQPPKRKGLTWSHYVMLSKVRDPDQRPALEQRILKEQLTIPQIRPIVNELNQPLETIQWDPSGKLKCTRGRPYHYRTREIKNVHTGKTMIEIDCGFHISIDPPERVPRRLRGGRVVRSLKTDQGYTIRMVKGDPQEILYTYGAIVERVVDADTLVVKVDCGFGIRIRQRLRLRGIDAPEADTHAGQMAKKFVEATLQGLPFVVIKTYGTGKYGRYLVDVFYFRGSTDPHEVAQKGIFLNQELLDKGWARIWRGD